MTSPCAWQQDISFFISLTCCIVTTVRVPFHAVGYSPLHIYGCLWLQTNRSGSGLVRHEAMTSTLLRFSEFSCLQLDCNNRFRHCRRNRMSLCTCLIYSVVYASLCKEDNSYSSLLFISKIYFWILLKLSNSTS